MRLFASIWMVLAVPFGACSSADDLGTILFGNVLFRHGDRTPIDPYPTDPYGNETFWPVPFAQLTPTGMHQHYVLGQWLRSRYNHILPDKYSLYDIYIRSTDVDRTLMSAEANLAGLYPPKDTQVWDFKDWMPIPIHTSPEKEDNILYGKKPCPRYKYELNKVLNSPTFVKINQINAELYKYLSHHSGRRIDSLKQLEYLYNVLWIEKLYNKTLPTWTAPVFPDKMKLLADLSFTTEAYNRILQRLKVGLLIGEMVNHMVLKSKGTLTPDRKVWIYSAHDETVANLLMAFGLFQPHCPPYAASILVELRKNMQNQFVVTISYKNSTGEPVVLTLPGCKSACPLNEFVRLTKDLIPDDWDKECAVNFDVNINFSISLAIMIVATAVLVLLIATSFILSFIYWHFKRSKSQHYHPLSTDPI